MALRKLGFSCGWGLLAASGMFVHGCDSGKDGDDLPEGCDALVEVSEDNTATVQEAFVAAEDGSTICLAEGEFTGFSRQLTLNANGVTVKGEGADATILDFSEQKSGGNGILIKGDDVTFTDLQVKNTPGDGIRADQVQNISFLGVTIAWDAEQSMENGAYGLYPVLADGVTIRDSLVYGARDAGIYVGQSTQIVVEDSEAYGNVAGIEIENSVDAIVRRNKAHDNTAGILIFNLPGLERGDGQRANVYENEVTNNNVPNFGEPGTVVAMVPPGVGVLILAADNNEVWGNTITGNDSVGAAIIAYVDVLFGDPGDPSYDIYSEGNYIHDNTWANNGQNPDDLVLVLNGNRTPSPEVIFGGCVDETKDNTSGALSNCLGGADMPTFLRGDLCGMNGGMTEDPVEAGAACMQPELPREL